MGVIVQFSYAAWIARYPEFASVTQPTAEQYFAEASVYHRNDGGGPVTDPTVQSVLLNMVTAHIAARYSTPTGGAQPSGGLVGRLTNATEGSVSAGTQNDYPPGTVQWFQQTKYGSDYYLATAPYRTMRYMPRSRFGANASAGGGWLYGQN